MKKISYVLVAIALLIIPVFMNKVYAADVSSEKINDKVTIYFFRGEGCSHCAEAEVWFEELAKDEEYSSYYNLVDYEVWYNEDNSKLMDRVGKELKADVSGVPLIVIGDKYYNGFSQQMIEDIKGTIKEQYNNEKYTDVVEIAKAKLEEKKNQKVFMPIIIISIVAVISVVILIFFTKEKEE